MSLPGIEKESWEYLLINFKFHLGSLKSALSKSINHKEEAMTNKGNIIQYSILMLQALTWHQNAVVLVANIHHLVKNEEENQKQWEINCKVINRTTI